MKSVQRQWQIAEPWDGAQELAVKLNVNPTVAQILHNRGIDNVEEAQKFLDPKLNTLGDPEQMPDTNKAAYRIADAVKAGEPIVVYGDYDVDGITATAILWHVLSKAGGKVDVYVPHRIEEGYGLNNNAIKTLADKGMKVLITVDCGIRDHEALAYAKKLGITTIVTDHHAPDENYPEAYAVIHPNRAAETGKPFEYNPCGATVAFKLAWAVAKALSSGQKVDEKFRDLLVELMSLVTLATIADIVPLLGENRTLVKFGLERLSNTKLPGLRALINSVNLSGSRLDSYHCGFMLGPRLNAAGRMGHAQEALELLIESDPIRSAELAKFLDKQNKARQKLEERITQEAISLAGCQDQLDNEVPILVLAREGWHAGVIGIVASKLVDQFNKPVVMIAMDGDKGQGSARSVPGYDINQGLTACAEHLIGFGGHAMAAGLRLDTGHIFSFMKALQEHASQSLKDSVSAPALKIDGKPNPEELDSNFIWQIKKLGPFGHKNTRPIFASGPTELMGTPKAVGAGGRHLSFSVKWNGRIFRAIAFNQADQLEALLDTRKCEVAFEPTIDEYSGSGMIQLRVKSIHVIE